MDNGINELWDCDFSDGGFLDLSRGMDVGTLDGGSNLLDLNCRKMRELLQPPLSGGRGSKEGGWLSFVPGIIGIYLDRSSHWNWNEARAH